MSKAMEGDLIRIVYATDDCYLNGDIFEVTRRGADSGGAYAHICDGSEVYIFDKEYEVIRKQAHAAQVGDLIRITKARDEITAYKLGGIYEVISLEASNYDQIVISGIGGNGYVLSDEYEIHRKLGEEDSDEQRVPPISVKMHVGEAVVPAKTDAELTQANRIRAACSELADLLVRKNHDYGDSFAQQYAKYGLMSALIRMDDKMRRLETLQGGEQSLVSESVDDSLQDLAGYAVLTLVERLKSK